MSIIDTMTRAANTLNARADAVLAGTSLTSRRVVLLRAVAGGAKRAVDVSAVTGIDRSTTATMIGHLVKAGMLSRERNKGDMRAMTLKLTPAGKVALRKAETKIGTIESTIVTRIGRDKASALEDMVRQTIDLSPA